MDKAVREYLRRIGTTGGRVKSPKKSAALARARAAKKRKRAKAAKS